MTEEYLEEHKALHKQIYDCKCIPISGKSYCEYCIKAIIKFANEFGAGTLTQDVRIENLQKENRCLLNEITRLDKLRFKLQTRVHKLEKK